MKNIIYIANSIWMKISMMFVFFFFFLFFIINQSADEFMGDKTHDISVSLKKRQISIKETCLIFIQKDLGSLNFYSINTRCHNQ